MSFTLNRKMFILLLFVDLISAQDVTDKSSTNIPSKKKQMSSVGRLKQLNYKIKNGSHQIAIFSRGSASHQHHIISDGWA